jgi:capsular polysaccharide export protein
MRNNYIPFRGVATDWPDAINAVLVEKGVTDLVLYGDTRPIHAQAVAAAKALGITIHVFEEGYLRPYWVTYEHGGANGHSSLMDMPIDAMQAASACKELEPPIPPGHWGDMRQHIFYGALYHWFVLFWNAGYRNFKPHRALTVGQEFRLYINRLVLMPLLALERRVATLRIRMKGFPYHLCLLQLEHDSSFQMHSPFATQAEFLDVVIHAFSTDAPKHHHLVFKAHPLEDGRAPLRRDIRRFANEYGVFDRVHYVRGGKLAGLLNEARTAVTVNSTAGQQALWRGIPLKTFGAAVYNKPQLVSEQPLGAFFANPSRPDAAAYREYRRFLLRTSQLPGSFYASRGRRQVLRIVVDKMLSGRDPYALPQDQTASQAQQLRVVK